MMRVTFYLTGVAALAYGMGAMFQSFPLGVAVAGVGLMTLSFVAQE